MDAKDYEIERLKRKIEDLEKELQNVKEISEEKTRIISTIQGRTEAMRGFFFNDKGI